MTTTDRPIMRTFKVSITDWFSKGTFERTIDAAYFKEEGSFVTFKDDANQSVFSVQLSSLVAIERVTGQPKTQPDA